MDTDYPFIEIHTTKGNESYWERVIDYNEISHIVIHPDGSDPDWAQMGNEFAGPGIEKILKNFFWNEPKDGIELSDYRGKEVKQIMQHGNLMHLSFSDGSRFDIIAGCRGMEVIVCDKGKHSGNWY